MKVMEKQLKSDLALFNIKYQKPSDLNIEKVRIFLVFITHIVIINKTFLKI